MNGGMRMICIVRLANSWPPVSVSYSQLDQGVTTNVEGIEEEMYRLRMKAPSNSGQSQMTWEIEKEGSDARPPQRVDREEEESQFTESHAEQDLPPITTDIVSANAPAFPRPQVPTNQLWTGTTDWTNPPIPSWQRVHQRLLNWAIVWSMSEFDNSLASTERGRQVDEVALTIWTAQVYKRYVRAKTTDNPPQRVDRLFVPPNVADAINSAVYNGRHGDACAMLKDMWEPFGFEGMPRLLIVLARHRRDANHWVVHR